MLQPTVELISGILPDMQTARADRRGARAKLAHLLAEEGLALVSAGTHPTAMWQETPRTPYQRYVELEDEFQDVARSILIFGLHVHIGVETRRAAVLLMNQLRTWLPHLLTLSTNSPFWEGRMTGLKSYRSVVRRPFPRTGVPEVFAGWEDFDYYEQRLVQTGCIDNGKRIWRDIRPMLSSYFIDENKWHVMRSGLDAEVVDFAQGLRLPLRRSLHELLDPCCVKEFRSI